MSALAERTADARDQGAALVVFPELALCGYPPEDLLLKTAFLEEAGAALEELATQSRGIVSACSMTPGARRNSSGQRWLKRLRSLIPS